MMKTCSTFWRCCWISLLLCIFGAVPASYGQQTTRYEGFSRIEIAPGLAWHETVLGALQPVLDDFPGVEEGHPKAQIVLERHGHDIYFDVIETGFADDAVAGEHFRGVLTSIDDGWELTEFYTKPICARGALSPEGLCP